MIQKIKKGNIPYSLTRRVWQSFFLLFFIFSYSIYAQTVSSVASGIYSKNKAVELSNPNAETIYYTVDGSTPTTSSPVYNSAIVISQSSILQFFSIDSAGNSETVQSVNIQIDKQAATTTSSVSSGTYNSNQTITLTSNEQTEIYYSLDGSTPTTSSTVYSNPILINSTTTIKYFSVDTAGLVENVSELEIVIDKQAPVSSSTISSGLYNLNQYVELRSNEPGNIYYSLDNSTPNSNSTKYTQTIIVTKTVTIKYFAEDNVGNKEVAKSLNIQIDKTKPVVTSNITSGTYNSNQTISLTSNENGNIYYTLNGDNPSKASTQYSTPIEITEGKTIKAISIDNAGNESDIVQVVISFDRLAPVTEASISSGLYNTNQELVLSLRHQEQGEIYYSLDGSTPNKSSTIYSNPIQITESKVIKYFSIDTVGNEESIKTLDIQIDKINPSAQSNITSGTYNQAQSVELTLVNNESGRLYYTENGTSPKISGKLYLEAFQVAETKTINYYAIDDAGNESDIQTLAIEIDNVAPIVESSLNSGRYKDNQILELSIKNNEEGKIYVTQDGSTPTQSSNQYTAPISVSDSKTIKYISADNLGNISNISQIEIIIDKTPAITSSNVATGLYNKNKVIELNSNEPTQIYYTLDSTIPSTNSTLYSNPIIVSTTTEINFFSVDAVNNIEEVKSVNIQIDKQAATTSSSVVSGIYNTNQTITLTSDEQTTIYYSIDGSEPTLSSNTYNSPIEIINTTTLKYFSVDNAGNIESIKTSYYQFDRQAPTSRSSVASGNYKENQIVSLISEPSGDIYYTVNGNNPTLQSTKYTNPFTVSEDTLIQFFSVDSLGNEETINSISIKIDKIKPIASSNVAAGTYGTTQQVTLSSNEPGRIYYSVNGVDPTELNGILYTNIISISSTKTLKYIAIDNVGNVSNVKSDIIQIDTQATTSSSSVSSGLYNSDKTVELLINNNETGDIYYTLDGSTPTKESTRYNQAIEITQTTTLKFFSVDIFGNQESINTVTLQIDKQAPESESTVNSGTFNTTQIVELKIKNNDQGKIYLTTDGRDPNTNLGVYDQPIQVSETTTIKFFSVDLAGNQESIKQVVITIDKVVPIVSADVSSGTYKDNQKITITSSKEATIYYSDDGSEPTKNSTRYSTPIEINTNKTIRYFSVDTVGNESTKKQINIVIDKQAATTVSSVESGLYTKNKAVELTSNEPTTIYYTVDGSIPSTNSTLYRNAIVIEESKEIKFFSIDTVGNIESEKSVTIQIDKQAATTSSSIASGSFNSNQTITLTSNEQATIYYTLDGSTPSTSSTIYKNPIIISATTTLKFFSVDQAGLVENVKQVQINIDKQPPTSTSSVSSGLYNLNQYVQLSSNEEGKIYYTLDGTSPTTSSAEYTQTIIATQTVTIKYFATDNLGNKETENTLNIQMDQIKPEVSISLPSGLYNSNQTVTLNSTETGDIYYTLNGDTPQKTSSRYSVPLVISSGLTLKAISVDTAGNISDIKQVKIDFDRLAAFTQSSVESGLYNTNQEVKFSLRHSDSGNIYYTLDGSQPSITSTLYTNPIAISQTKVIKYFSVDTAGNIEDVKTLDIQIDKENPIATSNVTTGKYNQNQLVQLRLQNNENGRIYYTLNGNSPKLLGTLYSQPFQVSQTTTIKYYAIDAAGNESQIQSLALEIDKEPPVVESSVTSGSYNENQTLSLTIKNNEEGRIYFTQTGITPNQNSTQYTVPIIISETKTIKYISVDTIGNVSEVNELQIVIDKNAAITTSSVASGIYNKNKAVELTTNKSANIYYTLDGSIPSTNSILFENAIVVTSNVEIKFFSIDTVGNIESAKSVTIQIDKQAGTTTASVESGIYNSDQSVSLSNSEQATIYFTVDGSTPTTSSSQYSSAITISTTTTLKYFSVDQAGNSEAVQTSYYQFDRQAPTSSSTVASGNYNVDQMVGLASVPSGDIYYSVDGSTPNLQSTQYTAPFIVSENTTVKFFSVDSLGNQESINTVIINIDKIKPVVQANKQNNIYTSTQNISLTANEVSTIYFTTDGTNPNERSTQFTSAFDVNETTVIKFFAKDLAGNISDIQILTLTFDRTAPTTVSSLPAGYYNQTKQVKLSTNEQARTYFTIDGSTPSTSSNRYYQAIPIDKTTTLKFFSIDEQSNTETIKTLQFIIDTQAAISRTNISSGSYNSAQSVTITSNETTTIYFTLDGSTPTIQSNIFSSAITVNQTTLIKFFSVDLANNVESVKQELISIDTTNPTSSSSIPSGNYNTTQVVNLNSSETAQIYFTTDLSTPTLQSQVFSSPLSIENSTTIKFFAKDLAGNIEQKVNSISLVIDRQSPITTPSVASGGYNKNQVLNLTINETGSTFFSLDNSIPTLNSTKFSSPLTIEQTTTINYFSVDLAGNKESMKTTSIKIDKQKPITSSSVSSGRFAQNQNISFTINEEGTTFFTLDSSTPSTNSTQFSTAIPIQTTTTINYFSKDLVNNLEDIKQLVVIIDKTPAISTSSVGTGFYNSTQTIALSVNESADIFFTLDGTQPTKSSTKFTSNIQVSQTKTIKFFSVDLVGNTEQVKTVTVNIDTQVPVTTPSIAQGTYATNQTVALQANKTATIFFTTDGSNPTTSSTKYSTPIPINQSTTLKYFSVDLASNTEQIKTTQYIIDKVPATTQSSVATGFYNTTQSVNLSTNEQAVIYFTKDGKTPSKNSSIFSSAISVAQSQVIKFFSIDNVGNIEAVSSVNITIDKVAPETQISITGDHNTTQNITLTTNEPASIYYTLDGSTPTTSSIKYTGTFNLNSNKNLKYFAVDRAGNIEATKSKVVTIDYLAATTTSSVSSGSYNTDKSVVLSTSETATIYFTLDTTTPNVSSSIYANPILIQQSTQIRFFSVDSFGNTESPKSITLEIDKVPPITASSVQAGTYSNFQNIVFTTNETSTTYFTTDGSTPDTNSTVFDFAFTIESTSTVKFFSVDSLGNQEAVQSLQIIIDQVGPNTTCNLQSGIYTQNKNFSFSANEQAITYYRLNTDSFIKYTPGTTLTISKEGVNNLSFYSIDAAGNKEQAQKIVVTIDKVAPTTNTTVSSGTYSEPQYLRFETESSAKTFFTLDGSQPSQSSSVFSNTLIIYENTVVKFFSVDQAGNVESVKSREINISLSNLKITAAFDSGGLQQQTASTNYVFQSIGPIFSEVRSNSNQKVINGIHFDSAVKDIYGYTLPFDSKEITLNATVQGTITSQVEFEVSDQNGNKLSFSNNIDTNGVDGWNPVWDSSIPIPTGNIVSFRARAFDGLSYGRWHSNTDSVKIDNLAPVIRNFALSLDKFSPNNSTSVGIKDTNRISFDFEELFFNKWEIEINNSSGDIVKRYVNSNDSKTISFDWSGTGTAGNFVQDDAYRVSLYVYDQIDNVSELNLSTIVDNTSPRFDKFSLSSTAKALNSEKVDLNSQWTVYDQFDSQVEFKVNFSSFDPQIKEMSNLMLWLDGADPNALNEIQGIQNWYDKSSKGNHFSQSLADNKPSKQNNSLGTRSAIVFDRVDDSLKSILTHNVTTAYVYSLVYDENNWKISTQNVSLTAGSKLSLGMSPEGVLSNKEKIAELLVFNSALSQSDNEKIINYLNFKWEIKDNTNTTVLSAQTVNKTFSKENVKDSTFYQFQVEAEDDVGNKTVEYSNMILAQDRTAPKIDTDFIVINGVEDINFTYNPDQYKSDNLSGPISLSWKPSIIFANDNAIRSSEEILDSVTAINQDQDLSFDLKENRNTDINVNPSVDGNIYGKAQAWVSLRLEDAEGNFAEKEVQLKIQPVNDKPIFSSTVGQAIQRDSNNNIIYNLKFDEDTVGPTLKLDTFVQDVDNILSDLNFKIDNPDLIYTTDNQNNSQKYDSTFFQVLLGADTTDHSFNFLPGANFYGDTELKLRVLDTAGLVSTQNIIVRIWPVNDKPIIKDTMALSYNVNEDNTISIDFNAFEDDVIFEDRPPTNNNLLNWSVVSYDDSVINLIQGQNSSNDTLTFQPVSNIYGTTNVVLKLQDTDTVAETVFPPNTQYGGYNANPQFVTKSIQIGWVPVNDSPTINSIANLVKNENDNTFTLDLSSFKSDIEDKNPSLNWSVSLNETLVGYQLDSNLNQLTFSPKTNAWGTTKIKISLTDTDEDIAFIPYSPNKKTVSREFDVVLNPKNNPPSLTSSQIKSLKTQDTQLALTYDELQVSAIGYSDVGYASGSRDSNQLGDEYNTARNGELNFNVNQKLFNYKWFIDNTLVKQDLNSSAETSSLTLNEDYEGKQVKVEVFPFDGFDEGNVLTVSMNVNTRPAIISQSNPLLFPTLNFYTNTSNINIRWPVISDSENNDIYYRLKVWKVSKLAPIPTDTSLESSSFYDSQWVSHSEINQISQSFSNLDHATYYWRVWTGNKFGSYIDALNLDGTSSNTWTNYFNVDLIDPTNTGYRNFVFVNEITQNAVIDDAGNTRILYGEKPSDVEDEYLYKIELEYQNSIYDTQTQSQVITTTSLTIVEYTSQDTWSYLLQYPNGTTTYNIYLIDKAINKTLINTFVIKDDTTPPTPLTINDVAVTSIQAITSLNAYYISGKKEIDSAIYYEGYNTITNEYESAQIVGFTPLTDFSFYIYPDKPSGNLVVKDRAGNAQSIQPRADITFYTTLPEINTSTIARTKFNSKENRAKLTSFGLTTQDAINLSTFDFNFSVNRPITTYKVEVGNTQLKEGTSVINSNSTSNISIEISEANFSEGENNVVLYVKDEALNVASKNFTIILKSKPPSMNMFLTGSELSVLAGGSSTSRTLKLFGKIDPYINVLVNNNSVIDLETNWMYFEQNFNPETTDIEVTVIDDMYNVYKQKIWDKNYFSLYSSNTDIKLPLTQLEASFVNNSLDVSYSSLPDDVKELLLVKSGLSIYARGYSDLTLDNDVDDLGLVIPEQLSSYLVSLIAKGTDDKILGDINLEDHDVLMSLEYPELKTIDEKDLRIIFFNKKLEKWEKITSKVKVDSLNKRLLARVSQTGLYRIASLKQFSQNLSSLRVYPNPWIPSDGNQETGDYNGITFDQLTEKSTISIYTITGELIINISPTDQAWQWNGLNQDGQPVFSGVYLYIVDDGQTKKRGKITIVR